MRLIRPIRPIADDFDHEVEAPRRLNSYDGLNNPPPLNSSVTLRLSDYGLVERYFKGSILRPAWGMGSATLQNERQLQNPSFLLPGGKNVSLRGHSLMRLIQLFFALFMGFFLGDYDLIKETLQKSRSCVLGVSPVQHH